MRQSKTLAVLPTDGGVCEKILSEFSKVGIDVDAQADQFQYEGAKSFIQSWNDLMEVIASRSATLKEAAI